MMKVGVPVLIGLLTMSVNVVAQERPFQNCVMWRVFNEQHKTAFVAGYQTAMLAIDGLAIMLDRKYPGEREGEIQLIKTMKRMLWPKHYRVGAMVLKMDVYCGKSGNSDRPLCRHATRKITSHSSHSRTTSRAALFVA